VTRPNRTTAVRLLAVVSLVAIARVVPGVPRRGAPAAQPAVAAAVPAANQSARPVRETPTTAALRMLAAYATYPRLPQPEAEASVRGMASIRAMDRVVAELDADLARLAAGYPGGPTRVWEGPLATREIGTDELSRRVEVWFARVVAPPGRPVYAEWRLGTLDLLWERDGWRLDRMDEVPGPRPVWLPGGADSAAAFLAAVDGFSPVGSA
jgi:hypothetical protein